MNVEVFDIIVIGSGPAGQKAAIQGVKSGKKVALCEREPGVGGECVHRGTIPSKTLRESAARVHAYRQDSDLLEHRIREDLEVGMLMSRLGSVVHDHVDYMTRQIDRNGVTRVHGKARFLSPHEVVVRTVRGEERHLRGEFVVIATGSRPRTPPEIPVDHENILDSDSILSMIYLPRSLTVLGGGVIACEYASTFATLGVSVTMIDRATRPLQFMDAEVTERFVKAFEAKGGSYVGGAKIASVTWDGVSRVRTTLDEGRTIDSDKMLVALGRCANVQDLALQTVGLATTPRGVLAVDASCRTEVPNIFAVGDVIGPPALAASSMEQGRRAVCAALGLDPGPSPELSPIGIYTIPELASVGLTEAEARERHGEVIVGRARFSEVARGLITGCVDGLLKIVADAQGHKLLGAHIVGEGATELIHLAQMAMLNGSEIEIFVENIFNFPTLAEAYRVAALDVVEQRAGRSGAAALPSIGSTPATRRAA